MGLLELFTTACVPVFNMLLVTGFGSFLATDFAGLLSKEARKHLNNIVFYVFNPSLVAIYLAKTITMESLAKLWFMPVNILLAFTFGLFFGWIVVKVTRAPAKLRGLILGCCSAGNLGNIFLIIIPALCKEKGSPFGEPDVCQTYGLAYSSLSMAIGAVFLWSIVYNIVRVTSNVTKGDGGAQTKVLISGSATENTAEQNCSASNDHTDECTLPLISTNIPPIKYKVPLLERTWKFLSLISGKVDLKKLFAPSTIAVIVGFIIGGTPFIRNAIIGDTAPLRVLQESAELIGCFLTQRRGNSIGHVDNGSKPSQRSTRWSKRPAVRDSRRRGCQIRPAPSAGHRAGEGSRPAGPRSAGPSVPVHPPPAVRRAARDEHRDYNAAVRRGGERVLRDLRVGVRARVRGRHRLVRLLHVDAVAVTRASESVSGVARQRRRRPRP
ncbi:hypothetical protein PAHAL_2G314600 [Panicum hallii]|uniref:Protein PIN-LIKES 3 n=1 Tax=Panicum hallii TaxID=206008 RepID=A0A2S3H0T1_9POAL|nr:protein PIN-LIKES 3-like isoform X1 [Panicum hallii]PAN13108.1 hypothetical protein PAHAL_2G314600 [Panicum hallii]PAN13110.1 hypothetical protein PAHAL_2G314600 [Panicum hallii]